MVTNNENVFIQTVMLVCLFHVMGTFAGLLLLCLSPTNLNQMPLFSDT